MAAAHDVVPELSTGTSHSQGNIYAELHFTYSSVFCIAIYLYTIQNKTYKNLQYLYELIPFIVPHTVFLMIKEF